MGGFFFYFKLLLNGEDTFTETSPVFPIERTKQNETGKWENSRRVSRAQSGSHFSADWTSKTVITSNAASVWLYPLRLRQSRYLKLFTYAYIRSRCGNHAAIADTISNGPTQHLPLIHFSLFFAFFLSYLTMQNPFIQTQIIRIFFLNSVFDYWIS